MSQENFLSFQSNIKDILSRHQDAETCWIAYSGGLDSHVLLNVLAQIKNEIKQQLIAVHINHGMSNNSDSWAKHCKKICEDYAIEFQSYSVDLSCKSDKGTEAFAREKRYEVLGSLICEHDLLFTAHHTDDQLETIILQLMRGSGPDGLVGMPQEREFCKGSLVRPLLNYSRKEIYDYALSESLVWTEDESNKSDKYDRNYLRNKIIPGLITRWPGALKTIKRASKHQADARSLINEISKIDLDLVCNSDFKIIDISEFDTLSPVRKNNVLRAWVKKNKFATPNSSVIKEIMSEVIYVNTDRNPCVRWKGVEVRRYRGQLYIMETLPHHDITINKLWNLDEPLDLISGCIKAIVGNGSGIRKDMLSLDSIEIRYRQGGEKIRPSGQTHKRELKKMFQDEGVLPWLRDRVPLIFHNDELIAVADLWVEQKYAATESEPSWQIIWERNYY